MEALLALIPTPANLLISGVAVLGFIGWLWRMKANSYAKGKAEERAKTDAANRKFIEGYTREKDAVDRLGPSAVDDKLRRWSSKC